jgi:hypothetical protein
MDPADDYDLWLRLLPRHRFVKLEERLYRYRLHEDQCVVRMRERQTRLVVLAKLQHVRRLYPDLPMPARLGIVGSTRGDAYYRTTAAEAGFEPAEAGHPWDVLVVTDFGAVERYREESSRRDAAPVDLVGNFLVKTGGTRAKDRATVAWP